MLEYPIPQKEKGSQGRTIDVLIALDGELAERPWRDARAVMPLNIDTETRVPESRIRKFKR